MKDTSGHDRVAMSGEDLDTVYLVRGAEGHCQRWLKLAGGPYDGLLLSSANVFGRQLGQMIDALCREDTARAETIMRPVHEVVRCVFERVGSLSVGNPFTNANKAIDHFMAYGPDADRCPPPRLHAGCSLDPDILTYTGDFRKHDLLPAKGYLDTGGPPGLGGC